MDTPLNWKAAEKHVTAPFPTSDRSLEDVKLRCHLDEPPTSDRIHYIEGVDEWGELAPELFMNVDVAMLTSDTGVPMDQIDVSVIVRDRELSKFERIVTWSLHDFPQDAWPLSPGLQKFSRCPRLDIAVVASPRVSVPRHNSATIPYGAMLAAKTFKVRVPSRGIDLPFVFVEPSTMQEHGLDPDTVCYVRWKGEDVTCSADELIEIWLNKNHEDKFLALSSKQAGQAALHIGRNISAYVFANVLAHVLDADVDSGEDGLVRVVGDLMEEHLEMTLDDARQTYRDGPGGQAKLMPWCWALTGADKAFAAMKF